RLATTRKMNERRVLRRARQVKPREGHGDEQRRLDGGGDREGSLEGTRRSEQRRKKKQKSEEWRQKDSERSQGRPATEHPGLQACQEGHNGGRGQHASSVRRSPPEQRIGPQKNERGTGRR